MYLYKRFVSIQTTTFELELEHFRSFYFRRHITEPARQCHEKEQCIFSFRRQKSEVCFILNLVFWLGKKGNARVEALFRR